LQIDTGKQQLQSQSIDQATSISYLPVSTVETAPTLLTRKSEAPPLERKENPVLSARSHRHGCQPIDIEICLTNATCGRSAKRSGLGDQSVSCATDLQQHTDQNEFDPRFLLFPFSKYSGPVKPAELTITFDGAPATARVIAKQTTAHLMVNSTKLHCCCQQEYRTRGTAQYLRRGGAANLHWRWHGKQGVSQYDAGSAAAAS